MNPITRVEVFLDAAAGNEQTLPTPITREEVFLKAIVDAQGGGGSGLPSVSDVDNGKVLTVVDGTWASADGGSSGGGVLVVHINADTGALDKTWQEIHDAGFAVLAVAESEDYVGVKYAALDSIGVYESTVYFVDFGRSGLAFVASAASDYPAPEEEEPVG